MDGMSSSEYSRSEVRPLRNPSAKHALPWEKASRMGRDVRSIFPCASLLAALAMTGNAWADPILECRVLGGDDIALRDCLRTQLDISYRAMTEAQDLARGAAHELDQRTGTDAAVLGVEASQQAWEAYRDVECQTIALFAGAGAAAEAAQLACAIRLTRARTDGMLRFASEATER
jgi:uncharacterized protein YecT (DUF1311 family)